MSDDELKPKWHANPVLTALAAALVTGALSTVFGLIMFSLSRGVDNTAVISANTAKISLLQAKVDTVETRIATNYVTLEEHHELLNRYSLDIARLQANDDKIQAKLDYIIQQQQRVKKTLVEAKSNYRY